jgi:hypothetical protein
MSPTTATAELNDASTDVPEMMKWRQRALRVPSRALPAAPASQFGGRARGSCPGHAAHDTSGRGTERDEWLGRRRRNSCFYYRGSGLLDSVQQFGYDVEFVVRAVEKT